MTMQAVGRFRPMYGKEIEHKIPAHMDGEAYACKLVEMTGMPVKFVGYVVGDKETSWK